MLVAISVIFGVMSYVCLAIFVANSLSALHFGYWVENKPEIESVYFRKSIVCLLAMLFCIVVTIVAGVI
jgi:hypothetical protein